MSRLAQGREQQRRVPKIMQNGISIALQTKALARRIDGRRNRSTGIPGQGAEKVERPFRQYPRPQVTQRMRGIAG